MSRPRTRDLLLFSLLFFPINLFWTPMTVLILPQLVKDAAGDAHKGIGMAVVGSGGAIAATIVTLLVGVLSDNTTHRFGRRYPWVVWGLCIGAPATLFLPLAHGLWQLLFVFVIVRLGLNTAQTAYSAVVPDRVPRELQGQAAGFGELWDAFSTICGIFLMLIMGRGVVNGVLHSDLSEWGEARAASFIICAICALLMLTLLAVNLRWVHGERLPREKSLSWGAALRDGLRWRPGHAPNFSRLLLAIYVMRVGMFTGEHFLHYYATDALGLDGPDAARKFTAVMLWGCTGGIVGALTSVYLGMRTSKRKLLYGYSIIAIIGAVLFCAATSIDQARWIAFIYSIGQTGIVAVEWGFATTLVPAGKEARYLAIHQTANTIPLIAVSVLGGAIGQIVGYRALFWTIPFWLLAGMFLLARVKETPIQNLETQPA